MVARNIGYPSAWHNTLRDRTSLTWTHMAMSRKEPAFGTKVCRKGDCKCYSMRLSETIQRIGFAPKCQKSKHNYLFLPKAGQKRSNISQDGSPQVEMGYSWIPPQLGYQGGFVSFFAQIAKNTKMLTLSLETDKQHHIFGEVPRQKMQLFAKYHAYSL